MSRTVFVLSIAIIGALAGLTLFLESANSKLEEVVRIYRQLPSYRFDIAPLKLERFVAVELEPADLRLSFVYVPGVPPQALDGWAALLRRLELTEGQEILLMGVPDQGFRELETLMASLEVRHRVIVIDDMRTFAARTGLAAPMTVVMSGAGQIRLISVNPLGDAEISVFEDVVEGRLASRPERPFLTAGRADAFRSALTQTEEE